MDKEKCIALVVVTQDYDAIGESYVIAKIPLSVWESEFDGYTIRCSAQSMVNDSLGWNKIQAYESTWGALGETLSHSAPIWETL